MTMTKLKYKLKTLILISFIFAFNLNTALSDESDDALLSAAEIKEFQANGFLKSKFFVDSMSNDKNQFILNGKLKTKLIVNTEMRNGTEAPAHIELIFADSLLNNNPFSNCIITGRTIGNMAYERADISGNKLICNSGTQKKEQNIRALFQDGDDMNGLKGVAVTIGTKDLTKNELATTENQLAEIKMEKSKLARIALKQSFSEQVVIFVDRV
jgi:hypothetical protein